MAKVVITSKGVSCLKLLNQILIVRIIGLDGLGGRHPHRIPFLKRIPIQNVEKEITRSWEENLSKLDIFYVID